jgi:dsDNA-specific endonuclease/ATPase MutS2
MITNFLSMFSIMVGMFAAITAIFLWIIDRDRKNLEKTIKKLQEQSLALETIVDLLIRGYSAQEQLKAIDTQKLQSLLRSKPDILKNYKEAAAGPRLEVRKTLRELMLYSSDELLRESAYKWLTFSGGNNESLEIMRKIDGSKDPNHEYYRKSLARRLNRQR